jgi:hypothetical protein
MMAKAISQSERRRYWMSFAGLAIALPVAVLVHSWESIAAWRAGNEHDPVMVGREKSESYAGAEWRLTTLSRLPSSSAEQVVVLAEFEARIEEPNLLTEGLCAVVLTDAEGRRWQPAFLIEPIVRKMHPETADKPRCGGLAFRNAGKGGTASMAETFVVPATANGLALSVTVPSARPRYLLFR